MNTLVQEDKSFSNRLSKINQLPTADYLIHYRNTNANSDSFIKRKVDYTKMKVAFDVYRQESERLLTYKTFPNSLKNLKENLAKSGFYCVENNFYPDQVKCIFCQGILDNWSEKDKPMKRHRFSYPTCPFVISLNVGNVPAINYPNRLPDIDADLGKFDSQSNLTLHCVFVIPWSDNSVMRECSDHFDIEWREETFVNNLSLKHLALDGLFVTKDTDGASFLQCCWCVRVTDILDGAESLKSSLFHTVECSRDVRRRKYSVVDPEVVRNYCQIEYAVAEQEIEARTDARINYQSMKKHSLAAIKDDINYVVEQRLKTQGVDFPSIYEYLKAVINYCKNKKENPARSQGDDISSVALSQFPCVVCYERTVEVIFLPCGHLKTCDTCSKVMVNCPVCRMMIVRRVKKIQFHEHNCLIQK